MMIRSIHTSVQMIRYLSTSKMRFRRLLTIGIMGVVAGSMLSSRPVQAEADFYTEDFYTAEADFYTEETIPHSSESWAEPLTVAASPGQPDHTEWIEASIYNLRHSSQRWIQVDLSNQQLTAWEGDIPIFSSAVSTGRASDATPIGVYEIQTKHRTTRMQGNNYDIPDVPYAMYFSGSYAIHGAYWHNDFGAPISSGCINLPLGDAAWLFDWASTGTTIVVQN
jgi:lipoprotein-anchoring transpeptidase ErfK/SrfK